MVGKVKDPKRVKAGKKSKRKGNSNERAVAKLLATWWGAGEFMRTPSSGGWGRSKQVRDDFNAAGDIVTTATDFPFCVEVKSEERWELEQLLTSPETCPIARWWKQAVEETPVGKSPLLLFTRKHRPWYAMGDHASLGSILAFVRSGTESSLSVWTVTINRRTAYLMLAASLMSVPPRTILAAMMPVRRPML